MSEQVKFLKNAIASAQSGNAAAVDLLRQICQLAMTKAPKHDLITVAQCLCHIGAEATRVEIYRN